jgi:aminomethyltransferase
MSSSTDLNRTPLDAEHRALGARMVPFAGFEMPIQYTGIIDEHRAVRSTAGMFDVSHMGEVMVEGPSALDFVQRLVTNDASKLVDGRAMYTVMCRPDGGIVDDLLVYRLGAERFMLVINASNVEKDLDWMHQSAVGGASIEDVSDQTALIALQGPQSFAIFEAAFGVDVADLKFYHFRQEERVGSARDVIVSHTGYTGEKGLELYCKNEDAAALWMSLMEAGRSYGLLPCGLGARDTLRIESGYCLYGNDITDDTNPLEAGLGWLVKFDKGDFVGREALLEVKEKGPARKLIGFVVEERGIPRSGYPVEDDSGNEVGIVTSGTQSPILGKGVGLGYVNRQDHLTSPGAQIRIVARGKGMLAQVARPPFHKEPFHKK